MAARPCHSGGLSLGRWAAGSLGRWVREGSLGHGDDASYVSAVVRWCLAPLRMHAPCRAFMAFRYRVPPSLHNDFIDAW